MYNATVQMVATCPVHSVSVMMVCAWCLAEHCEDTVMDVLSFN